MIPGFENCPAGPLEEDATAKTPERRAWPRFAIEEQATVVALNQGVSVAGRIVEISQGGCRLQLPRDFRVGVPERVEVSFRNGRLSFRLGAVTQWSDGRGTLGIGFLTMPEPRREELRALTAELAAKADKAYQIERIIRTEPAARERAVPPVEKSTEQQSNAVSLLEDEDAVQAFLHLVAPPLRESRPASAPSYQTSQPAILRPEHAAHPARPTPLHATQTSTQDFRPQVTAVPVQPLCTDEPGRQSSHQPHRERRSQARHLVDTFATIYFIDVAARERGRILDVSISGCRIRTESRFPSGIYRRVEAEFKIDGLPFRLAGVVQSMHDRHTVGIRFLNMSDRKRACLEELMGEIEEMRHSGLLEAHHSKLRGVPSATDAPEATPTTNPQPDEP